MQKFSFPSLFSVCVCVFKQRGGELPILQELEWGFECTRDSVLTDSVFH